MFGAMGDSGALDYVAPIRPGRLATRSIPGLVQLSETAPLTRGLLDVACTIGPLGPRQLVAAAVGPLNVGWIVIYCEVGDLRVTMYDGNGSPLIDSNPITVAEGMQVRAIVTWDAMEPVDGSSHASFVVNGIKATGTMLAAPWKPFVPDMFRVGVGGVGGAANDFPGMYAYAMLTRER